MRIGILTFHRALNCGAALQAWALQTVLERLGHTVEFPNCQNVGAPGPRFGRFEDFFSPGFKGWLHGWKDSLLANLKSIPCEDIRRARFRRFSASFLHCVDLGPNEFLGHYDLLVIGSDQVWSAYHCGTDAPLFFGENLPEAVRKISYAASCGDRQPSGTDLTRVLAAVSRCDKVSVREKGSAAFLSERCDKPVEDVLDPTLLLKAEDYQPLYADFTPPQRPYLYMYTLYPFPSFVNLARRLAAELEVDCVITPMDAASPHGHPKGLELGVSPDRMVGYIAAAKYVIAASFHGTALSTIFRKPFLSLRKNQDSIFESRPANLLALSGNLDRLVTPQTEYAQLLAAIKTDYHEKGDLSVARERSLKWLSTAVGKECR